MFTGSGKMEKELEINTIKPIKDLSKFKRFVSSLKELFSTIKPTLSESEVKSSILFKSPEEKRVDELIEKGFLSFVYIIVKKGYTITPEQQKNIERYINQKLIIENDNDYLKKLKAENIPISTPFIINYLLNRCVNIKDNSPTYRYFYFSEVVKKYDFERDFLTTSEEYLNNPNIQKEMWQKFKEIVNNSLIKLKEAHFVDDNYSEGIYSIKGQKDLLEKPYLLINSFNELFLNKLKNIIPLNEYVSVVENIEHMVKIIDDKTLGFLMPKKLTEARRYLGFNQEDAESNILKKYYDNNNYPGVKLNILLKKMRNKIELKDYFSSETVNDFIFNSGEIKKEIINQAIKKSDRKSVV